MLDCVFVSEENGRGYGVEPSISHLKEFNNNAIET